MKILTVIVKTPEGEYRAANVVTMMPNLGFAFALKWLNQFRKSNVRAQELVDASLTFEVEGTNLEHVAERAMSPGIDAVYWDGTTWEEYKCTT